MQEHNTVQISSDHYSDIVTARDLMIFFINLLSHPEETIFSCEKESLIVALSEVHKLLENATPTPSVEARKKQTWRDFDPGHFDTPWAGWSFRDGLLWDDSGNHYTPSGIKNSWQSEMIISERIGSKSNIRTMKDHLSSLKKKPSVASVILVIDGEKVVFTPNVSS
jgi:hypothetical protein